MLEGKCARTIRFKVVRFCLHVQILLPSPLMRIPVSCLFSFLVPTMVVGS
jgi:hypothetical protein